MAAAVSASKAASALAGAPSASFASSPYLGGFEMRCITNDHQVQRKTDESHLGKLFIARIPKWGFLSFLPPPFTFHNVVHVLKNSQVHYKTTTTRVLLPSVVSAYGLAHKAKRVSAPESTAAPRLRVSEASALRTSRRSSMEPLRHRHA